MTRLPNNYENNLGSSSSDEGQVNIILGTENGVPQVNAELPHLSQAQPVALMAQNIFNDADESEDDMEWEEVDIMQDNVESALPTQAIEVIIEDAAKNSKKRATTADPLQRILRLESHKMHAVALLASFARRNKWINDPLLHARLLSLTPLPLQLSFTMIHPKTQPDTSRRARLFQTACFKLTEWWHADFRVAQDKGVRNQTFLEVEKQRLLNGEQKKADYKGKGKAISDVQMETTPFSDRLRSVKSLMKHALLREGSSDTSSLLFTALCRALDIPARLVVSLQAVPWSSKLERTEIADPDPVTNAKPGVLTLGDTQGSEDLLDQPEGGVAKPRRNQPKNRRRSVLLPHSSSVEPPLEGWPPVVWTEVFSRAEGRWMPIDPIRYLVDKKKMFEPPSNCRLNRMMYVVAFEEDGYARDVTLRYAREFGAKTAKARASSRRGQSDWWARVVAILTRPYRLNRDDIEDGEFQSLQYIEGMPTSIGGFKDHPIYALERHLRRDEVIHPMQEVGKFRGEPVYPRSNVQRLRTAETWLHEGRIIQVGQQPLKRVAQRAHTINRKRILELAKAEMPAEMPTQGLYAEWQTELYVPDPVVDGRIPKNDFGNVNLFVPSMLPQGAAHLPFQGIVKIARQLQVDYAPAVTGFEFRKGHANPILTGVIVAAENEDVVLSAYWESAQAANEAERNKRHERVIQRWTNLVQGLRLRKRLLEDYGNTEVAAPSRDTEETLPAPGGFLTEYDGVIEHFSLPKTRAGQQKHEDPLELDEKEVVEPTYDPHHSWSDLPVEEHNFLNENTVTIMLDQDAPKTLRQYATDQYARLEHVRHEQSPVQRRKSKPNPKTIRPASPNGSTLGSDVMPTRKRPRRTKAGSSPKRQLRSGVRKSTRQRQQGSN